MKIILGDEKERNVQRQHKSSAPGGQINRFRTTTANNGDRGCRSNQASSKWKVTGYDELPAKLLKLESDTLIKVVTKLCSVIVDTGEWLNNWKKSVFVTVPKVTGTTNCEDRQTIALISHKHDTSPCIA